MSKVSKIGYKGALSLVIGNIIGVGIFTTTGYVTNFLDSPVIILSLWFLGGLYAISGAVVYGVLSKEYPLSGGDFHYLKSEIHPVLGYMFGWSALTITYTGSIAALSIGAATYFNSVFELNIINELKLDLIISDWQILFNDDKVIAIFLVLIFSWINYRGIKISVNYQSILTGLIVIFIFLFSITGIFYINNPFDSFSLRLGSFNLNNYFTAFIAIIFTFIGWTSAVYIAEEIERPKQLIPKSLLYGVGIVIILYLMINLFYLIAVPIPEMKNTLNTATLAANRIWGNPISIVVSFFIFVAVLSTINSTILSGSRIYMSMSREGFLFSLFSNRHPRFQTPHKSILIQAVWSIVLIFSGTFNQLLSFVVFAVMIFSTLAGVISIKISSRNKMRNKYFLILSALYTLICFLVSINTLITQFKESITGLILISLSILFYLIEKKQIVKN